MSEAFKFVGREFDYDTYVATFHYQNQFDQDFTESIQFVKPTKREIGSEEKALIERAMDLSFFLIGTSYYKAHPTKTAIYDNFKLDEFQAKFFDQVYQEGLSQYAYENNLTREDLLHFEANTEDNQTAETYVGNGILAMQSGGKDSLLVTELYAVFRGAIRFASGHSRPI